MSQRPLEEMVQTVSEQAIALARRELTAKARQASGGAAMVGGGVLLGTLAAGTGTAGLVLLLAGRPRPSAAALGVTSLYAGAGAYLAQEGVARLRAPSPPVPEEAVESGKAAKQRSAGDRKRSTGNRKGAASGGKRVASSAARNHKRQGVPRG